MRTEQTLTVLLVGIVISYYLYVAYFRPQFLRLRKSKALDNEFAAHPAFKQNSLPQDFVLRWRGRMARAIGLPSCYIDPEQSIGQMTEMTFIHEDGLDVLEICDELEEQGVDTANLMTEPFAQLLCRIWSATSNSNVPKKS